MSNGIGVIYPAPPNVAYSSLFYRYLKSRLIEEGIYAGTVFLDNNKILIEKNYYKLFKKAKIYFSSLPFEITYRDYVESLLRLNLPVWRHNARDEHVIIVGGPAVTGNPLPVAPLADAILIGELENIEENIFSLVNNNFSKNKIINELSSIPGMYVPSLAGSAQNLPIERNYVKNLNNFIKIFDQRIPSDVEPVWGKTYAIESSRGCMRGCRFCLEGFVFRPKRDVRLDKLKEHIDEAINQKFNKISFYSLSFFDNPWAEQALEYAIEKGLEASVPSLRIDTLNENRIELIKMAGQKTLTIAPESGSRRICTAINKNIYKEKIINIIDLSINKDIKQIKIYIIVGFPGETKDDLDETIDLIDKSSKILRSRGGRLKVSINPFIPKPSTPLQWFGFRDYIYLRKIINKILKETKKRGGEASYYDPRWGRIQTALGRGDSLVARLLVEWAMEGRGLGAFRRASKKINININKYIDDISIETTPPWHKVVRHPFANITLLRKEYEIYKKIMELE